MQLNDRLKLRRYGPTRRLLRMGLILTIIWFMLETYYIHQLLLNASLFDKPIKPGHHYPGRIFIASLHWNNEAILRDDWNDALVQLVSHLGPTNVFVSVYESGSWDDSKGALRELDARLDVLDVPRNITLSDVTHQDEISATPTAAHEQEGWIDTPRGRRELRRIPYLARLRNWGLLILEDLARQGIVFDTILFLNDVVFTTEDVLTLLDTNGGSYAAACSLDFSKPPQYYDTFALRDSQGHEPLMQTWPYFRSWESLDSLLSMSPIPVTSCWNGMVAMPTSPFLSQTNTPLRFRGIPDSLALHHLEGSECCLIHADNPLSSTHGVYLNPKVRVGYNRAAYTAVHPLKPQNWISSSFSPSSSLARIVVSFWENRLRRWFTMPVFERRVIRRRVKNWENEEGNRHEPGEFCLIDEMQVLVSNGWAHV
ncbi:polysaccharide export protein (CAP59), putative [Talaromyces stipitatus ATCC 10500]|uniref:Polysaccharide export protein (CAP59), putative n=1 Tax=Talaromyces stipitatus (strain ATCC 10500 / CBS 375.48 / QM 6759 / NRRL 1006) TaxID=441959 RepID=B8M5E5_TALSN|nr:polysaccharide export protein (CAP59), putative [Talaromyces stipitatus ATCC 10500]EED19751.1 polysaccharide export protein (CAP59), putative [Talaromyces stipitatus ATCC 10500]